MKDRIREIAGKIWTILEEKQNVDILTLPKILKERQGNCLPGVRLAGQRRQNKISHKARKTFVSLTHEEHEIFRTSLGALPE